MFYYMTWNTHDGEDIESRSWRSYLDLKRGTLPIAAQPPTEAGAVDVHCLASIHVMSSMGSLVTSMVRMAESYERVVERVEMIFQGSVRG